MTKTEVPDKTRASIEALNQLLADAIVFQQQLRHYHWTVKGDQFFTLHEVFERMYTAWATHVDDIAERVLSVGGVPLRTLSVAIEQSQLTEEAKQFEAHEMVQKLIDDVSTVHARVHVAADTASDNGDRSTENLMDDLSDEIEKDRWMLRQFLGK